MTIIQIIQWLLYGTIHSILAASTTKLFFEQRLGQYFSYYRIVFNIISILLLIPIAIYQLYILPNEQIWAVNLVIGYAGISTTIGGLGLIIYSLIGYDLSEFSGIGRTNKLEIPQSLKTNGLLKHVRHPLYTGIILFVVGLFIADGLLKTLVMAACVIVYIRIGIVFEERKLVREFGNMYNEYRNQVPMLWPRLW